MRSVVRGFVAAVVATTVSIVGSEMASAGECSLDTNAHLLRIQEAKTRAFNRATAEPIASRIDYFDDAARRSKSAYSDFPNLDDSWRQAFAYVPWTWYRRG